MTPPTFPVAHWLVVATLRVVVIGVENVLKAVNRSAIYAMPLRATSKESALAFVTLVVFTIDAFVLTPDGLRTFR